MDEKLPRGELKNYLIDAEGQEHEGNVELAGAMWEVSYTPLTLKQYIHVAATVAQPSERKMAVAEACNVHLNGEPVDWETVSPLLGLELIRYIDEKMSEGPGKNS